MLKSFISKALVLVLSFAFFGFVSPIKVRAASINFVKDSQNPLKANFFLLQTTLSKDNNGYKMWFTGHNGTNLKIGYSTSSDGINWPTSTFVSVNDSGDNHDPSLTIQNGINYIYYISEPAEGSGQNIKLKRAIANGSQFSDPQLIVLARQPWNSQKLSCPYVYLDGNTYFLFYCGTNGTGFNLGMAQSTDGVNFTPCSNNPIISGSTIGNSQLYVDTVGKKHLLFHSNNGIEEVESADTLNCNSAWTNRKTIIAKDKPYDQSKIISPSLVNGATPKELYYTARGPGTAETWKLNKTSEEKEQPKIVLVPGFFASWNQEAILHNQTVGQNEWKIPSFIHEYEGLIKTFDNIGLKPNKDYYVYPYDWRKSLNSSADDLKNFLQTNIWNSDKDAEVSLVGHSMGGVLSRVYAQKHPNEKIAKVVTAGSPHHGVVQVYQPLEAGETQKDDTFLWLGTKLLINLNRKLFTNDRKTVQNMIPSLYDLFPTYDFIRNTNGTLKKTSSLTIQNTVLNTHANLGTLADKLTVIYGNKSATGTPYSYRIINRALIDRLSGDYLDGRPFQTLKGQGDYLVPTVSSVIGNDTKELPLDHGELIYSKDAIRSILNTLSIKFVENNLSEGSPTQINASLIVVVQSPIEASLQIGAQVYHAEDGIIFVPNAQTGNYTLNVKKLSPGDYTVTVAQVAQNNDVWEQFTGTIEEKNIQEQDQYIIKYDNNRVKPQILPRNCSKFKWRFFNFRRKYSCRIKNLKIH